MNPLELEKINDEVYIALDSIVTMGQREIAFVKERASANLRGRARICAHKSNIDPLHEMLIAIAAESYIPPHKHEGKTESFHIIEGQVDIVLFDDRGTIENVLELGDAASGKPFFYRLPHGVFHTLLVKGEYLVVHEITNGPFARDQTALASWAPQEGNPEVSRGFMNSIAERVLAFKYGAHVCRAKH